jgi:hypothetical protein
MELVTVDQAYTNALKEFMAAFIEKAKPNKGYCRL